MAHTVRVAEIRIGEHQRAGGGVEVGGVAGLVRHLGDGMQAGAIGARAIGTQHRRVVVAADGDGDGRLVGAALLVVERDG